mmetsp:Transcript_30750/g.30235  ORF Transcript_30750/g.30235 Transcript_30750/m.30235 type:complete len:163 (+) Transcript_30750:3255-3743(+)
MLYRLQNVDFLLQQIANLQGSFLSHWEEKSISKLKESFKIISNQTLSLLIDYISSKLVFQGFQSILFDNLYIGKSDEMNRIKNLIFNLGGYKQIMFKGTPAALLHPLLNKTHLNVMEGLYCYVMRLSALGRTSGLNTAEFFRYPHILKKDLVAINSFFQLQD